MRRSMMVLALLGGLATGLGAQSKGTAPDTSSGSRFALGYNLYLSPQLWPEVGADDDPKFGLGLGGMIGIAWIWGDLKIVAGPHLSYNMWTADYSGKPASATQSVSFGMADAGLELLFHFDSTMGFWAGTGNSTMDASMLLDNGSTFYYPGLHQQSFPYKSVGVNFRVAKRFRFGIGVTQYEGAAEDATRAEFRFGIGY